MNKIKIHNLKNRTLLIIFLVILVIGGLRTYDDLKRNNEIIILQNNQIKQHINNIYYSEISKINEIMNIQGKVLSNSKHAKKLIIKNDRESLYNYSKIYYDSLKRNFPNINIMHFHLSNHTSFLRMHKKDKFSDNLKDIRPMITQAINQKVSTSGYEHGKKDINMLTYRVSFPIFDNDKLLAILEIGIDTNYISKKIEKVIYDMYKKRTHILPIIKKDTKNFDLFGDYVGSFNSYIYKKDKSIDFIIDKSNLLSKGNTLKVKDKTYYLKWNNINLTNSYNDIIGSYLYIIDISDDIIQNNQFFYSSLSKPILALIIILILVSFIFKYFYKQFLEMEKRTRHILDTQDSLIVLTDGENIIDSNSAIIKFLGFKNFEELKNNYKCISSTFIEGNSLLQTYNGEKSWIEYILENKGIPHKVGIKDVKGNINIFNISLNQYSDKDIVAMGRMETHLEKGEIIESLY